VDSGWYSTLCLYMMTPAQTPYLRRQVRKLLLYFCGTKEKYREKRDVHSLDSHVRKVRDLLRAFDVEDDGSENKVAS
jgi:E3 ubiquitin-protein ligase UBR4